MTVQSSFKTLTIASALVVAFASRGAAQQKFQTVGPNECINCHDHQEERQWYEKKEIPEVRRLFPDRGDKAGHINSLKQLDEKKGDEWAAAIGLKDKYDTNGVCVRCHATVFAGDANAGVSCESCHGPASGYLKPHQTKDTYDQSVAQFGMTRLVGNLQGWTQQCTNCHVMDDDRLIKAGHPNGDDFDLGVKYQPVSLHFKKKYAQADVAAIGKGEMEGILRRRGRAALPPTLPPDPAAGTAKSDVPPPPPPPPLPPTPPATGGATGGETKPPAVTPPKVTPPPAPRAHKWDPTSIDPPPPLPGDPTSSAPTSAPSSASTPAAGTPAAVAPPPPIAATTRGTSDLLLDYWWAIAGCVLLIVGLAFWLGTKKRG